MLTIALLFIQLTLASLVGLPAAERAQPEQPATQPTAQTDAQPDAQPAVPTDITTADELLDALETVGEDTRRLSATVRYIKTFAIQGDEQQRDGTLVFASEPGVDGQPPARRFGITFDRLEVGRRVEDLDTGFLEKYIFDGEWLAEVRPVDKQFVRRQVVPPGERWDPLRLGEGPFPIPIQQRREDILSRFDAELLDGNDAMLDRGVVGIAGRCYQLRLVPKAELEGNNLREIRVWYQKDTLLPRMAKTVNNADDESFVMLKDLKLNEEADFADADLSTLPPEDRTGWDITIEPFRE